MFAVGGGAMPVLCSGFRAALLPSCRLLVSEEFLTLAPELTATGEGGAAPYFSRSFCVELYLVAALNFSMAASR